MYTHTQASRMATCPPRRSSRYTHSLAYAILKYSLVLKYLTSLKYSLVIKYRTSGIQISDEAK